MAKALLVPGHTLQYPYRGGEGRAKCSCGELSPVLGSSKKRQQWHREHKQKILDGL